MVRGKSSSTADSLTHTIVISEAQTSPNERWLKEGADGENAGSKLLQVFSKRSILRQAWMRSKRKCSC